jgi:HEAT repeat protein
VLHLVFAFLALGGQDDKAADQAIQAFKSAYASSSEAERATAVAELARTPHAKTLKAVSALLAADGTTVRIAAARGLGGFAELKKPAAQALLQGYPANAKEPEVQAAILEALGKLDEESALPAIHRAFDEKESRVARAALSAAVSIRHESSFAPILDTARRLEKLAKVRDDARPDAGQVGTITIPAGEDPMRRRALDVFPACIKSLQDLTGEKHQTVAEWTAWWNAHKATWKPAK